MTIEQKAQYVFGFEYSGWVLWLEVTYGQPHDQVERKAREDKSFYRSLLLKVCERFPKDYSFADVVRVVDFLLSL